MPKTATATASDTIHVQNCLRYFNYVHSQWRTCSRGAAYSAPRGACTSPFFLIGAQILVRGRRVNGRRSRSRATARRAAIDSVTASWIIGAEEDGSVLYCRT